MTGPGRSVDRLRRCLKSRRLLAILVPMAVVVVVLLSRAPEAPASELELVRALSVNERIHGAWLINPRKVGIVTENLYRVWELETAQELLCSVSVPRLTAPVQLYRAALAPVGSCGVAWATWNLIEDPEGPEPGVLTVFDWRKSERVFAHGVDTEIWRITAIAASGVGDLLAWVEQRWRLDAPPEFRLHVVETGNWEHVLEETYGLLNACQTIHRIEFGPDARLLALGSWEGEVGAGTVDLQTGELLWLKTPRDHAGGKDIAFCPDGESFYGTSAAGKLTRFEARTGKILWEADVRHPSWVWPGNVFVEDVVDRLNQIDVSPDGRFVAASCEMSPYFVIVWEVATGEKVGEYKLTSSPIGFCLFFGADSKTLWVAGTLDEEIKCYRLPEAVTRAARPPQDEEGKASPGD